VTSLDGVFDASLAPETCLELLVFAILIQDSVGQAKAENLTGTSDSDARVAGARNQHTCASATGFAPAGAE
jgi:hypothetical protein